jgi:UDP-2-acetamido-3-amino-2,3-dideoxy-glucuronate N-acetyltransferase
LIQEGRLGRIQYIYSHRLNMGKLRREENVLWSFAPHDVSMTLGLTGEMPESVYAQGGNYLHKKISDVTVSLLSFPSGIKAHIFVSWLHPFKEQKLVVVGERKMAVFNDTLHWEEKLVLYPHQVEWHGNIPIAIKAEGQNIPLSQGEPLRSECAHFLECVAKRKRPITDGSEGLSVLKVLNACQRSLESGGTETISPVHTGGKEVFVHPTAVIDPGVTLGARTKIWHFSHILAGSDIGEGCNIGQNVVVGPRCRVGKGCKIQNNVSVYEGVTLEDFVFCGPSAVFTNVRNPRCEIPKMNEMRPTIVKKGATIGANSTIICGVTIGTYAFVGAGAVVTRDVPDYALVAGNPARKIGWMCVCGERLGDDLICPSCSTGY